MQFYNTHKRLAAAAAESWTERVKKKEIANEHHGEEFTYQQARRVFAESCC
jgi:hypothetical protein